MDSVIALFRVDFTGRGELADRQVNSRDFLGLPIVVAWIFLQCLLSDMGQLPFAAKTGADALPNDKNS